MTDVGIPKEFAEECSRHESNKLLYIMYKEEGNLTCKVSMYCKKIPIHRTIFLCTINGHSELFNDSDVLGIESILCN